MKLWQRFIVATFDVIRPFFGFMNASCIHSVSCSDYAKHMITTKPGIKSVFLIIVRVLSCNPITAIIMRLKKS
jgi:putative component of membrane protein insertase Oxa1/YidC/SpoIIIJ protein YidD